jgi:hypothetical protein
MIDMPVLFEVFAARKPRVTEAVKGAPIADKLKNR